MELQNLDEENTRIQDEIETIKKSIKTLDEDISRENGIIIDANSNEKRLKEEKSGEFINFETLAWSSAITKPATSHFLLDFLNGEFKTRRQPFEYDNESLPMRFTGG